MLALRDIQKSYDGKPVLQPMTLSVAAGSCTVLIGPSGCGKSTLLRIVIGLIDADAGQIEIGDQTLDSTNIRELRRRMGYVIQGGGLFPHLTARDNVTLMARELRWPAARIEQRVQELRALTGLESDLLCRYPRQLSGGQQQRVALMRALMLDPELLLLDEPLGALDPMIRRALQEDLKRIFQQLQKTVVLVTHDLGEAAFFADHIVLLRDGAVVQQGSIQDLMQRPADEFVGRFVTAQRPPWEAGS